MILPVNLNSQQGYYKSKHINSDRTLSSCVKPNFAELSDYKTGQAILVRNNISFKNTSTPIEITDRYNKSIDGKEHLNLSNVHVYEFPDTNLTVVLDIADNVECPSAEMELYNFHKINYNPVHAELANIIMSSKLQNIDNNSHYTQTGDYTVYGSFNNKNSISKIHILHNEVFNTKFSKKELEIAKTKLINYISSFEYKQKNSDLKYLYPKELMKSNEELFNDIKKTSIDDLSKFYNSYLNSCSATLYVTVSKSDFEQNNINYFKKFNKNIPLKLQKYEAMEKKEKFTPNKQLKVLEYKYGFMPLEFHFPISNYNEKESIIADLTSLILLGSNYTVLDSHYEIPINIKNSKDITGGYYYNIGANKNIAKGININFEIQELYKHINKVYMSDISAELETLKNVVKQDAFYTMTHDINSKQRLNFIKLLNKNLNIYELIDSINEKDIKDYISKYILNQQPIIHINQKSEFNNDEVER